MSKGAILSSASLSFTQFATSDGCFSSGIKSSLFTTTIESFSLKISKISTSNEPSKSIISKTAITNFTSSKSFPTSFL